jgi:2-dehydro-3-deoxy-D-arabinonate dehydratase
MHLFKTRKGIFLQHDNKNYLLKETWNTIINRDDLFNYLSGFLNDQFLLDEGAFAIGIRDHILAPIDNQEVWAAGVTYVRSRDARMDESKDAGGADFYSKVYHAERPELFFKAVAQRVASHTEQVFIRKDSKWNVPEPELTLYINKYGNIQAYTIGNDMSSRDIEGENPLYLPQAKVYERSAALGPCLYIPKGGISPDTIIRITIQRKDLVVFENEVSLSRMKRKHDELAHYLFRECVFEQGVYLMTGTGIVPPNDFTLQPGDVVDITIENIGRLSNTVAFRN